MRIFDYMPYSRKRLLFALSICGVAAFSIFELPFLIPPPVLRGWSAANLAGFNNKIAAVAAALLSLLVVATFLRWSGVEDEEITLDEVAGAQHLQPTLVAVVIAVPLLLCSLLGLLHIESGLRYMNDGGYFMEQIAKHADYGRQLYNQLEFPYGPLLFYGPIWVRTLLRVPLATAYCITLVLEQTLGLLMLTYVLNQLPMLRRWKILFLVLCAALAIPVNLGINYTFFRFIIPRSSSS